MRKLSEIFALIILTRAANRLARWYSIFVLGAALCSCSKQSRHSETLEPYTHLYAEPRDLHIWSYLKVVAGPGIETNTPPQHLDTVVRGNGIFVLDGPETLEFRDGTILFNQVEISVSAHNVVIEHGRIRMGAFIRTFK